MAPERHHVPRPRRLRDWLATIPMILLLPALIVASNGVGAATPTLVAPETAAPGSQINLGGNGFPRRITLQVLWDGSAAGMPTARTDARGNLNVKLRVPADETAGAHKLAVVRVKPGNGNMRAQKRLKSAAAEPLASVDVQVVAPVAEAFSPTPTPTPGESASGSSSASASASPTASGSPTPSPGATSTANPTPVPTVTATPRPTATPTPPPPTGGGSGIWISHQELMSLPTSGAAWVRLASIAGGSIPREDLACQDAEASRRTMVTALVAARTNSNALRAKVRDVLMDIIGTENGSTCGHDDRNRALGVGRNLAGYVIAADLINFRQFDSAKEATWRSWLSALRSKPLKGAWALNSTEARDDHSNWGAHQAAALTAADAYLGDQAALAVDAAWARAWVDPTAQKPWGYHTEKHDYSWSSTGIPPKVPVNPKGATKNGVVVDGIPLVDMQRGGGFTTGKPTVTDYPRESLVGRTVQFELLYRAGYPSYSWGDQGLLRIAQRLLSFSKQWDSAWYEPRMNAYWILADRYGASLPRAESAVGRQVWGVDWTHR